METNYTVEYFIRKFKKIPSNQIGDTQLTGCAYGQCRSEDSINSGIQDGADTDEGKALQLLFNTIPNMKSKHDTKDGKLPYLCSPARINNGDVLQYQQRNPKQRILAALYDIKKMQEPKQPTHKDITSELAVLPINETSDLIVTNNTVLS